MNFDPNNNDHVTYTSRAMVNTGGHFASFIGKALQYADRTNRRRLLAAFPDLFEKYGPGSWSYEDAVPKYFKWPADFDGAHSLAHGRRQN